MAIDPIPTDTEILVKFGDGASPETFAVKCSINLDRSISFSQQYEEDELPDCDTPTNPHSIRRQVRSIDLVITGQGKADATDLDFLIDWWKAGGQKNVKVEIGPSTTGRSITGAFYIQLELTGQSKRDGEFGITLTPVDTGALVVADLA
jgi:hypothetical protein